jgi:diaminopimelate decarboxylase
MAEVLSRAIAAGVITGSDTAAVFFDLSRLDVRLERLRRTFPPTTLHAVAVKANPVVEVLRRVCEVGHGAEVASLGELELAREAGFSAGSIVFDSPVKTREELELALGLGVGVNASSLRELDRIAEIYPEVASTSRVGLRINPETGQGTIAATSVAVAHSKFGVSLRERRAAITQAFSEHPWLTGLHLHIGSQGMSREQLVEGVGAVWDLLVELRGTTGVREINIGGGLPARYRETDAAGGLEAYVAGLGRRCPGIFGENVRLTTEMGRWVHASCGWVAARVEDVIEHADGMRTLLVHVGADMFLRKAYCPEQWHHDISVCDAEGRLREGPQSRHSVAGPLCFAGDYLSRDARLPMSTREGDIVLIHDAGAYTFSMWSMYNSRQLPVIIGYEESGKSFRRLRPRQSAQEIVAFWSAGEPEPSR